jgi:hypothetical protein
VLIVRAASDLFFPPQTCGAVHGKRHRPESLFSDAVITQLHRLVRLLGLHIDALLPPDSLPDDVDAADDN